MSPFDTTHFLTPSPHQNRPRRARVEKVGLRAAGRCASFRNALRASGAAHLLVEMFNRSRELVPAARIAETDHHAAIARQRIRRDRLTRPGTSLVYRILDLQDQRDPWWASNGNGTRRRTQAVTILSRSARRWRESSRTALTISGGEVKGVPPGNGGLGSYSIAS
jgi:hypothetical protein